MAMSPPIYVHPPFLLQPRVQNGYSNQLAYTHGSTTRPDATAHRPTHQLTFGNYFVPHHYFALTPWVGAVQFTYPIFGAGTDVWDYTTCEFDVGTDVWDHLIYDHARASTFVWIMLEQVRYDGHARASSFVLNHARASSVR